MGMLRCGLIAIVLSGATAAAEPPRHDTPKTAQQLAVEAQEEFRILSQPLEQAARARLVEVRRNCAGHGPEIGLDWETEETDEKLFVAPAARVLRKKADSDSHRSGHYYGSFSPPRGERLVIRSFHTKKVYTLKACQKSYRFEFRGVRRVYRTGLMDTPFAGDVEFAVITISRSQSKRYSAPLAIPEPYRFPKKGELPDPLPLGRIIIGRGEVEELDELEELPDEVELLDLRPFRVPYLYHRLHEDLPTEVRPAADELVEACAKAKPKETTKIQTVVFRYWPAEKRWDWRTDRDRRWDAERAKRSEKPSQNEP